MDVGVDIVVVVVVVAVAVADAIANVNADARVGVVVAVGGCEYCGRHSSASLCSAPPHHQGRGRRKSARREYIFLSRTREHVCWASTCRNSVSRMGIRVVIRVENSVESWGTDCSDSKLGVYSAAGDKREIRPAACLQALAESFE